MAISPIVQSESHRFGIGQPRDANRDHAMIARIGMPPCEMGIGLPVKSGTFR